MCQTCIGCGKCNGTPRPKLAQGDCPFCGQVNPADAPSCSACGNPLPLQPGMPRSSR